MHKNQWKSEKLELALEKSVEFVSFKNDFDDNDIESIINNKTLQ